MADGGIGESALLGAALGGGSSILRGSDPLQGALMGGLLGGAGGYFGGAGAAPAAVDAGAAMQGAVPFGYTYDVATGSMMPAASASDIMAANAGATPTSFMDVGAGSAPLYSAQQAALANQPWQGVATTTQQPGISNLLGNMSTGQKIALGGGLGLAALMAQDRKRYGIPDTPSYSGPLSKFKYDPNVYQPDIVRPPAPYQPRYQAGGAVEQMSNANAIGQNTGYPQADIHHGAYATPWQTPVSQNMLEGAADTGVNPISGEMNFADGGGISGLMNYARGGNVTSLGGYSDGGQMLEGPGDGMSDSIPGVIADKKPARLADGEFVVPADVVSHLGNGSTDAGARQLYSMMDKVRKARTGRKSQGKQINPRKYMPA